MKSGSHSISLPTCKVMTIPNQKGHNQKPSILYEESPITILLFGSIWDIRRSYEIEE